MAKFEAHITMPREQFDLVCRARVDPWQYSQIDGDPIMGKRPYCYLTAYDTTDVSLLQRMQEMCRILDNVGVEVLRQKIERIIYDTKTGVHEITV